MFKNWKKKSSARVEIAESKRFSLLGSKKARNLEIPAPQSTKIYPFSYSEEKRPEVDTLKLYTSKPNLSEKVNDLKYQNNQFVTNSHAQNIVDIDNSIAPQRVGYYAAPTVTQQMLTLDIPQENPPQLSEPSHPYITEQSSSILQKNWGPPVAEYHDTSFDQDHEPIRSVKSIKFNIKTKEKTITSTSVSKVNNKINGCTILEDGGMDEDEKTIYRLENEVQNLQKQVKDIRQYFKGLLKHDMEGFVTACIKLQALVRGHLVRRRYQEYIFIKLRGYKTTKRPMSLNQLRNECSMIGMLVVKKSIDTERDLAALRIQKAWRGCMIRERMNRFRHEQEAAIKIQSIWRGYRTREMNPRILIKILQRRLKVQQRTLPRLAHQIKTLQDQINEETMIRKEHADSLSYLHAEVRTIKCEKPPIPKKSSVALRKPRQSTGSPVIDISKFASLEDFAYLKAEIEYLHQRMNEISMERNLYEEDTSR